MRKFKIQTLTPFLNGFTMVELIFIIVLIGILAGIGVNYMPDNRLLNDVNFLSMKIKQRQKSAIGYDISRFSKPWSKESSLTCITLDTSVLENEDLNTQKPHKFSSTLSVDGNSTLCFDEYGRPYQSEHLLLNTLEMNLTYKTDQYKSISVMPISGYVIINH